MVTVGEACIASGGGRLGLGDGDGDGSWELAGRARVFLGGRVAPVEHNARSSGVCDVDVKVKNCCETVGDGRDGGEIAEDASSKTARTRESGALSGVYSGVKEPNCGARSRGHSAPAPCTPGLGFPMLQRRVDPEAALFVANPTSPETIFPSFCDHHEQPFDSISHTTKTITTTTAAAMGLVDYSDSDSDSEPTPKPQPAAASTSTSTTAKKPFQKLIDRSGSGAGKIVVSLPSASSADVEEPPAKRAKTIGASSSGSRFSNLGSFLPPPKKTNASVAKPTPSARGGAPAPGVHLRTAAEPAFRRSSGVEDDEDGNNRESGSGGGSSLGNALPPPKRTPAGPSIPEGMKPESEVKLVGKPLMFKPLSVMRKPAAGTKKKSLPPGFSRAKPASTAAAATPLPADPPAKKKVSLFSTDDDDDPPANAFADREPPSGAYEPLFTTAPTTQDATTDATDYIPPPQQAHQQAAVGNAITDGLQLSAKARRELFGRTGNADALAANTRVVNFNMEQEYEHNEALRQSGDQAFNPVRSIAPGKHSLRQMVNMVQSNQSALEDSFAQGRANKRDAAGRYGWK